jgi:hypothetical protein
MNNGGPTTTVVEVNIGNYHPRVKLYWVPRAMKGNMGNWEYSTGSHYEDADDWWYRRIAIRRLVLCIWWRK